MSERRGPSAVRTASLSALCGYWAWVLLSSPDSRVVLEGRLRLPLAGMDIASGVFFLAAPLIVFAAFLGLRSKARMGWPALIPFPAALLLNASRSLTLHDPVISYLAAGAAFAGIAWIWASLRPFRRGTAAAGKIFAATGLIAALGIESVLVFFLIPWSLRGDLPGSFNGYPFGPALRSVLYANLAGYERRLGTGARSLRGIRLEGADLSRAVLKGVDLRGARLFRARMERADLEGSDLRSAGLVEARLSFVNFRRSDLSGAELSGAYSMGADLRGASFRGVRRHVVRLHYADGRGTDFTSAELLKAECNGADFRGAVFRDAVLSDARLIRARFDGADLSGANLSNADLEQTTFRGAILAGTDLSGAKNISLDELAAAATLRGARLDAPLLEELKRRNPGLF